MNLNDKEKSLLCNMIHDHLWRQENFYRGSTGDKNIFPKIEKDALKLKNKLLNNFDLLAKKSF